MGAEGGKCISGRKISASGSFSLSPASMFVVVGFALEAPSDFGMRTCIVNVGRAVLSPGRGGVKLKVWMEPRVWRGVARAKAGRARG